MPSSSVASRTAASVAKHIARLQSKGKPAPPVAARKVKAAAPRSAPVPAPVASPQLPAIPSAPKYVSRLPAVVKASLKPTIIPRPNWSMPRRTDPPVPRKSAFRNKQVLKPRKTVTFAGDEVSTIAEVFYTDPFIPEGKKRMPWCRERVSCQPHIAGKVCPRLRPDGSPDNFDIHYDGVFYPPSKVGIFGPDGFGLDDDSSLMVDDPVSANDSTSVGQQDFRLCPCERELILSSELRCQYCDYERNESERIFDDETF